VKNVLQNSSNVLQLSGLFPFVAPDAISSSVSNPVIVNKLWTLHVVSPVFQSVLCLALATFSPVHI
jgi:hypothetical protein